MTNPLTDVLPAVWRKRIYAIVFLAALVFAAYQAAEGNWETFTGTLLGSLIPLLAASNTDTE